MSENAMNLLLMIKNNTYTYHMLDIDKELFNSDQEKLIDSYFLELIENKYIKRYEKRYIKNDSNRVYEIEYIVGE